MWETTTQARYEKKSGLCFEFGPHLEVLVMLVLGGHSAHFHSTFVRGLTNCNK